jgi:hypothetical protein
MLTSFCSWLASGLPMSARAEFYLDSIKLAINGPVATCMCSVAVGYYWEHPLQARSIETTMTDIVDVVHTYIQKVESNNELVVQTCIPWKLRHEHGERIAWIRAVFYGPGVKARTSSLRSPTKYDPRSESGDIWIVVEDEFMPEELKYGPISELLQGIIAMPNLRRLMACAPGETSAGPYFATHLFHTKAIEFVRDVVRQLFLLESYLVGWAEVARIGELTSSIPSTDLCYGDYSLIQVEDITTDDRLLELKQKCSDGIRLLLANGENNIANLAESTGKLLLPLCDLAPTIRRSISESSEEAICSLLSSAKDAELSKTTRGYLLNSCLTTQEASLQSALDILAKRIAEGGCYAVS